MQGNSTGTMKGHVVIVLHKTIRASREEFKLYTIGHSEGQGLTLLRYHM